MRIRSLCWAFVVGCASETAPATRGEARSPAAPPPPTSQTAEPRAEGAAAADPATPGHFEALETELAEVLVWVPSARAPRPLLLVAHGAGDAPDWHCQFWSQVVQNDAFVLCLRGRPLDASSYGFYFPQHHDLDARIDAALFAFESRYTERWTGANSVYVGYSQGATMGALLMPRRGATFDAVLLIEGGYEQWPVKNAREFRESGGERVFFACGTRSCERGAKRSVEWLRRAHVEAEQRTAHGAGHTPGGPVAELSIFGLAWLVRDLPSWRP